MALSKKDKQGIVILVVMFVLLGIALILTLPSPEGPGRGWSENVLVEQRMNNLERNR
jgi:hypothetical protein